MADHTKTDAGREEEITLRTLKSGGKLETKNVVLHSLPCRIQTDGQAPVSDYFHVHVEKGTDGQETYSSSFRGRKLAGTKFVLPDGVHGVVMDEKIAAVDSSHMPKHDDVHQRVFEQVGQFSDLMYWERDNVKAANQLDSSLQWIHLARAVHFPCTLYAEELTLLTPIFLLVCRFTLRTKRCVFIFT